MKLNLGSGTERIEGYTNVDRVPLPGVDVVHDLDVGPWPFVDGLAARVIAHDVFEHVADPILFMTECWRVLGEHCLLVIRSPHYRAEHAYTDPTHRRFCTHHTWDYWIPGTLLYNHHNLAYGGVAFTRMNTQLHAGQLYVSLRKETSVPDPQPLPDTPAPPKKGWPNPAADSSWFAP